MSGTYPLGPERTPNWQPGYVPPAPEWSMWWSNKVDFDDARLTGGPFLSLSGGTMTGPLLLHAAPTQALEAATKAYVDAITPASGPFLPLSGGTMTGLLTLALNPSGNLDAVTKQYADGIGSNASNALTIAQAALPRSGGTMTGPLTLSGDPTNALVAATKQYVDRFLPLSGGTLTGTVSTNANGDIQSGRNLYATNAFYANAFGGWEWSFAVDANGSKFQSYRTNWYDAWNGQTGMRTWNGPGGLLMSLDSGGHLGVTNGIAVSGNGIAYNNFTGHTYGFGWNGAVNVYVDGGYQGDLAFTSWVTNNLNNYLPLSGGHVTGSLGVDGPFNFTNNGNVSGTLGIGSYGEVGSVGWYYAASGGNHGFQFWYNGSVICRIDSATDIVLATASDARLKRDIAPTELDCLAVIRRTPLFQFRFKDVENAPLIPLGFVAQEQERVFPASVGGELTKSMDLNVMVAALVGAVQQLAMRLDRLDSAAMKA